MGCEASASGISVQFFKRDGEKTVPDGAPLYGGYAKLYGRPRSEVFTGGTAPAGHLGSEDWLTLIAVADSPEKLSAILTATVVEPTEPQTSASSRQVFVELHVGDIRKSLRDCETIASGPVLSWSLTAPKVEVVHVMVVPNDIPLDDLHPFIKPFKGGSVLSFP